MSEEQTNQNNTSNEIKQQEYLAVIDSVGKLTGEVCERVKAHLEGIPHYSVHIWVVNTTRFSDDLGIYICHKASKNGNGYLQFRTAGGHVAVDKDWELQSDEETQRKGLLKQEAIREVQEELGLSIDVDTGTVSRVSNQERLKENSNFRVIEDSMPYKSLREKNKNGEIKIEVNNEHIGVYSFEFDGEITDIEEREIDKIELVPSKKLREMLENSPETFGHKDKKSWKDSCKYKAAVKIVAELQKQYNIGK